MPQLGEIKRGWQIGKKGYGKYIWKACEKCGRERWTSFGHGHFAYWCWDCTSRATGALHPTWKGGRYKSDQGYIKVYVNRDDPFYSMTGVNNYALEHRLIMARHLGRCLDKDEVVHHLNGIRDDNRIKNLSLLHRTYHGTKTLTRALKQRIRELENQLNQRGLWQNEEDKT